MPKLGGWEIALILVIVLIIFGVGKLPQIGTAMGKSIREFRKARNEDEPQGTPVLPAKGQPNYVQSSKVEPTEKKD